MKNIIKYCFPVIVLGMMSACAEDIDVDLPDSEKKVVIEGTIENGKYAEVIITRNIGLFTEQSGVAINDFYIFDAQVYVTDNGVTDTCTLTIDSASSLGVIYRGHTLLGVPGHNYILSVHADGKTFSSVTSIPQPIELDSVWWKPEPNQGDSLGFAWARISEPSGFGNNYRFYAKRPSNRRFIAPFGATWDDKYVDGKSFEFAYTRGYDPTDGVNTFDNEGETTRGYYFKTDTVYIRFASIDKAGKDFYTTFENAVSNNGNPFASPVTILTNLTGGALGVWCGQGATYDTIMPTP
jgi:hypothetical protein